MDYTNLDEVKKLYDDLYAWDKQKFAKMVLKEMQEHIRTPKEEILDMFTLRELLERFDLEDILDCYTSSEVFNLLDENAMFDYCTEDMTEEDLLSKIDDETIIKYILDKYGDEFSVQTVIKKI